MNNTYKNNKVVVVTNPTADQFLNISTKFNAMGIFVTHSGNLHSHEVVAAALIQPSIIIRTRDKSIIENAINMGCWVNDVGMDNSFSTSDLSMIDDILNPHVVKKSLDHHSVNCKGMSDDELLDQMFHGTYAGGKETSFVRISEMDMSNHGGQFLMDLLLSVARIDNNIPALDYISSSISDFNPCWNEEGTDESYSMAFCKAYEYAEFCLRNPEMVIMARERSLKRESSKEDAKRLVKEAIDKSRNGICILDNFVPWQEVIITSNMEMKSDIDFVIFPELGSSVNWRVQAVPRDNASTPINRIDLLTKEEMDDCYFVHNNKFIGGFGSKKAAIEGAKKSKDFYVNNYWYVEYKKQGEKYENQN